MQTEEQASMHDTNILFIKECVSRMPQYLFIKNVYNIHKLFVIHYVT